MASSSNHQNPRAVIHKRILDEAKEKPDASMTAIADDIPGASTDLVERVLLEYGDPGDVRNVSTEIGEERDILPIEAKQEMNTSSHRDDDNQLDMAKLSANQRETLLKINEDPKATQREIGVKLGVTAATISNRLRKVPGFEWKDREEFVSNLSKKHLIGDGQGVSKHNQTASSTLISKGHKPLKEGSSLNFNPSALSPELSHKIIHACMSSNQFSKEEELAVIRAMFRNR